MFVKPSKLIVNKSTNLKPKTPNDQLVFGHTFSDHMLVIDWNKETGWR